MHRLRRIELHHVFIGLLALAVARPADAQTERPALTEPLTLDAAITYALKNNRDVGGSGESVAIAQDAVANARTKRLPSLELSSMTGQSITEVGVDFPAGAFGTFPGIGPVPSVDTRVTSPRRPVVQAAASLTQPLSQLHRLNLNVKATSLAVDIEQERRRATMQATAASVRKAYYGLLQIDASLRAADAVLASAKALDGVVTERVTQRVVLKGDGLQSQLRVAEAAQQRLTLQHARAEREEQFNLLLGRDPRTPVAVVAVPIRDDADVDLEAVIREAVDRRADVRAARLRVQRAEVEQRAVAAGRIPDVSLAASYQSFYNTDLLPKNLASVGVQVKWEPWDWGRRQREANQKGHEIEQARLALKQAEDTVRIEVARSFRDIQRARGDVLIARAAEEVAQDRSRVTTERIKVAAALPVDGLSANRDLAEAGARAQDALSGYWAARAAYEQAIGEDVR
jgi:outer membrane protein TolC